MLTFFCELDSSVFNFREITGILQNMFKNKIQKCCVYLQEC